ncbi:MAG: peptidoglycan DD-metalloendopeptidase family protein [Eubacteriales bacterium]
MNPMERWDEWEWEKAANEIGKEYGGKEYNNNVYSGKRYAFATNKNQRDILKKWSATQKKVTLSALLFLTIIFAANSDDIISKGVYIAYKSGMDNASAYPVLNSMVKDAMGMENSGSIPVQAGIEGIFYPPVAGTVKVGFNGIGLDGNISQGVEIESAIGTPVLCPEEGVILDVVVDIKQGKSVRINHGNGWETILANLGDVAVEKGQPVSMGTKIGTVGLSEVHKKTWLYMELLKDGKAVNPLPYLIQN